MELFDKINELIGRISQDLVELGKASEKLNELAVTDELTGLYNRRLFWQRLTEELSRAVRYNESVSLLVLDIDNFKTYNDTYGHYTGDQILREVSNVIRNSVRSIDVVARYGGEEFAVILPQSDLDGAIRVAERVRNSVARHGFSSLTQGETLTISGGVASFPRDARVPDELFEAADRALFQAKLARDTVASTRECDAGEDNSMRRDSGTA